MRTREAAADKSAAPEGVTKLVKLSAGSPAAQAVAANDATLALRQLLRIELDIRKCRSASELFSLLTNEMPRLTGARQAFLFDITRSRPHLVSSSSATTIDRQSPTVRWLEKNITAITPKNSPKATTLSASDDSEKTEASAFPFRFGYWLPLQFGDAKPGFGTLLVAEKAFDPDQLTIAARLIETAAHALQILRLRAPLPPRRFVRVTLLATAILLPLAMFWPVPMTALAPMEIVAQDPYVIAAPIDGVVDEISVPPNTTVSAGTPIIRYVDTIPRNQMIVAERELGLAEAKLRQVQQLSFSDERAKREMAQVKAEVALKQSELDLARDTFEKTVVRAPREGTVIYGDRKDWVGRPVSTGQRILEIADPTRVEVRAFMPAADILDLKSGGRVKLFLDGAPLHPVEAQVSSVSHVAKMVEGQGLAYRVQAVLNTNEPKPRLGLRGTAQLFSEKAPLGYYLFRRPIGWMRQKVGF